MDTPESRRLDDPDIDLMLRFQAGDESAFEELVKRHTRAVLGLVHRYLPDPSQAEDVAQEVFVKVFKARLSWEPQAKFSTWLFRITVNHCLNQIRARRHHGIVGTPEEELVETASPERPADRMNRADLQEAVRAALDALPESQRMAVILARYEELPYEEIGRVMGLSVEAVKSLVFRAKENLRQKLGSFVQD